jgi:hypothetical protein
LKKGLRATQRLASAQDNIDQTAVDRERDYFARVMQMTPAMLNAEIQRQQQQRGYNSPELNFLVALQVNRLRGPELGAPTTEQMQAKAKGIVDVLQTLADQQRAYNKEIQDAEGQIADLNCDNLPSVDQSVPGGAP